MMVDLRENKSRAFANEGPAWYGRNNLLIGSFQGNRFASFRDAS